MKYFGWIFLFFIMVYLVPLSSRPLLAPDEFRYAEIPREMLAGNNLTTPTLLGVRYFEKTPMGYWLTAGSIKLFGENRFAVRLPSALAAGLTALLLALLVHQHTKDRRLAAFAAIIYLSCGLVYALGTTAVLDSLFTMFITGASGCAFLAVQEKSLNRRKIVMYLLAGIFAGCGFLTKGFLAFAIPAATMAGYLLWSRKFREFMLAPLPVLAAAAAVILPWALTIHQQQPDFWRYFLLEEHFRRFAGENAQHARGWYYYLPVMLVGILPAGLLGPAAVAIGRDAWKKLLTQDLMKYAVCAVLLPLLLLSCSRGKLATYLLPCFPPLSLLMAAGIRTYINSSAHHRAYNWVLSCWSFLMIIAGIFAIVLYFQQDLFFKLIPVSFDEFPAKWLIFPVVGVSAVFCGLILLFSQMGNWRGRLYLFFVGLALLPFSFNWWLIGAKKMPEHALEYLKKQSCINPDQAIIVTSAGQMQSIAWFFRRSDIRVLNCGEITYGNQEAVKRGEPSPLLGMTELRRTIADPERKKDVLVILFDDDDEEWEKLPKSADGIQVKHHLRWAKYPGFQENKDAY